MNMANAPKEEIQLRENLRERHGEIFARKAELLEAAATWPEKIDSEQQAKDLSDLLEALRKLVKLCKGSHEAEKAPFLAMGRVVDSFFKTVTDEIEPVGRRLKGIGIAYGEAKAAEERRIREAEANRLKDIADAAFAKAQEEERIRLEEKRKRHLEEMAALVAMNPNLPEPAKPVEPEPDNRALQAAIAADEAAKRAEKAALAKPAELSRVRGDLGSVMSVKYRWTGEVSDRAAIDLEALREHLDTQALDKAVRAYVNANRPAPGQPAPVLRGARIWQEAY